MAQLVLSNIGQMIGSRAPEAYRAFAMAAAQAAGSYIGANIDQRLFGDNRRRDGARLTDLHLQGSTEGASIPAVFGRVRIAGQVIWAARFKERAQEIETGGGKGGSRFKSTEYSYSLSFAVGLCEGEIVRIGRAWANGEPFDLSEVGWRLHRGAEHQEPDPLIEAIEGAEAAPAYRGLAYVVFEDLPLARFGNVMPQLSFEVIRAPKASGVTRFEERVRGVCMIPGSGEFVYATVPVRRVIGPGRETAENVHVEKERANFLVALDQLKSDLPNCDFVMLVVSWFGTDLRCGECQIKPGVEIAEKETAPFTWCAGGVTRESAHLVSQIGGAPALGGTPADASIVQAITALKARGYKVGLYPFIQMDIQAGNGLPDPYGGAEQAAYPWRGRINLHPAPGEPGTPDKSAAAGAQIASFFGDAEADDFALGEEGLAYSGPAEWSLRRFVLHNAALAAAAGGVDAFVIGSELIGVTRARDGATSYPAVEALRTLAADVRGLVGPETTLTYSADWSEYYGHQPQDGSGDVFFHLDPLWADNEIDVIGLDWYAPLTDWRAGHAHLDAEIVRDGHDPDYLVSRIEAGEAYEWYYASDADRAEQERTSITDGAYDEPWIYRAKDLRNFWGRAHHNRPGGVRDASSTAWVPQSKPVWLIELGCPAIDKGGNAPNLFIDDKSAESALPPFSTGARDDLIQRRVLDAYLSYWDGANNPTSEVYDGPMLALEGVFIWCWDARPFPGYPARADVWSDGASWRRGHWLTGRAGLAMLPEVVEELCARACVDDADASQLSGAVSGYIADAPASARAALEPLMAAYAFDVRESGGLLTFAHPASVEPLTIARGELTADTVAELVSERGEPAQTPIEARLRYLDATRDYQFGAVGARRLDAASGGVAMVDAPLVLEPDAAESIALRVLAQQRAAAEGASIGLGPEHLGLEPGDRVAFNWAPNDVFEIARIEDAEARRVALRRVSDASADLLGAATPSSPATPAFAPTPAFAILDLPPLPGAESDDRPLAAVFAAPWVGAHDVYLGASQETATKRGAALQPAIMGELIDELPAGSIARWDEVARATVRLYGGTLASVSDADVLEGANAFAVRNGNAWEILQARDAVLVAPNTYELSHLLRGQQGSEQAMANPAPAGGLVVKLDARLSRLSVGGSEWGETVLGVVPPAGGFSTDTRAAKAEAALTHAQARPFAPAHLRAERTEDGDVRVSWVRRARIGGDPWGEGEPPLDGGAERYRLEILDGSDLVRSLEAGASPYLYAAADQIVDFGTPPAAIRVRIAELNATGVAGLKTDLTLTL